MREVHPPSSSLSQSLQRNLSCHVSEWIKDIQLGIKQSLFIPFLWALQQELSRFPLPVPARDVFSSKTAPRKSQCRIFLCRNWLQFGSIHRYPSQLVSKMKVGIMLVIVQLYIKWNRLSKIIYRRFAVTIDIFWQPNFSCRPSTLLPPLATSQFLPCKQQKCIGENEKVMNQSSEVFFNWPWVDI